MRSVIGAVRRNPIAKDHVMKLKLFAFAAVAALTIGAGMAQAEPLVEAKNQVLVTPTTPQVAYPPICRWDPIRPKYCRRW
jgi:hypothetical protein